ncbi:C-type lectin domain family 5 member A-like [Elgaria multicarinata webbii]|uniref:C-type lectin domain family 5 member A-like n=1 Tax=Elgaria multicarinata webbii TaxID=159646 RepID=UPI002FCD1E9B
MNWNLAGVLVTTVVIKLIGTSLFLLYFSQISQEVPNIISAGKTSCPVRWILYEGNCYYFSALEKMWDDSQKDCAQLNSHLAVVNSKHELMFLMNETEKGSYFLGLTQRDVRGQWRWIDNTEFDPNIFLIQDATFNCALIGFNSIGSRSCVVPSRWICEENT